MPRPALNPARTATTVLALAAALFLCGCGGGEPKGATGASAPLDTHRSLTVELIDLNNAFGDTLAGVTNPGDARVAVPQLEEIGIAFEKLAVRMENLGLPVDAERAEIGAMIAESKIELKRKATRLSALMLSKDNIEIGEILHEGIDKLHKRLDQFEILERWADMAGTSSTVKNPDALPPRDAGAKKPAVAPVAPAVP